MCDRTNWVRYFTDILIKFIPNVSMHVIIFYFRQLSSIQTEVSNLQQSGKELSEWLAEIECDMEENNLTITLQEKKNKQQDLEKRVSSRHR